MKTLKPRLIHAALFCLFLPFPFLAMGQETIMQWDFENITNRTCVEPATGVADTIEGNFEAAPGVVGRGLRLDGFTTRIVRESLPILQPGQLKSDLLEQDYVTIGDYDFNQRAVAQELRNHPADLPKNFTVQQFNFKSENKPFICFEPGNRMFVRYVALGYNHCPVAQARCDGRWIKMFDRPSHVSSSPISDPVIHENGNRAYWNGLYGMNRMSMKELIHFGRSWTYPAELSLTGPGFTSHGYDKSQRCYQVENTEPKSGQVEIVLKGSKDSPVVNPAIRIKNWDADEAKVLVNGKESSDCRLGFNHQINGTDLVLFAFINETAPVQLTIQR